MNPFFFCPSWVMTAQYTADLKSLAIDPRIYICKCQTLYALAGGKAKGKTYNAVWSRTGITVVGLAVCHDWELDVGFLSMLKSKVFVVFQDTQQQLFVTRCHLPLYAWGYLSRPTVWPWDASCNARWAAASIAERSYSVLSPQLQPDGS